MRPKGGSKIFSILVKNVFDGKGTGYVSYFDFDGDSIIAVPFPLKIHDSKKIVQRTDQPADGQNLI